MLMWTWVQVSNSRIPQAAEMQGKLYLPYHKMLMEQGRLKGIEKVISYSRAGSGY